MHRGHYIARYFRGFSTGAAGSAASRPRTGWARPLAHRSRGRLERSESSPGSLTRDPRSGNRLASTTGRAARSSSAQGVDRSDRRRTTVGPSSQLPSRHRGGTSGRATEHTTKLDVRQRDGSLAKIDPAKPPENPLRLRRDADAAEDAPRLARQDLIAGNGRLDVLAQRAFETVRERTAHRVERG